MSVKPWVIGLTGPFGSGCSLAAKYLEHERGFTLVKLSTALGEKWKELHPQGGVPPRSDLQALGDDLRREKGRQVLVEIGFERLNPTAEKIVVDGIRNPGEVDWLRLEFGYRFTLIAVLAPPTVRW